MSAPPLRRRRLLAAAAFAGTCLVLLELACQAWARLVVFPGFDRTMAHENHYYAASTDPALAYDLRPDFHAEKADGMVLHINRFGIRDRRDDRAEGLWRLAVLGDSVVFGVGLSQEKTLPSVLQREVDPGGRRIRVLNFGLGGLNLAELVEFLRIKDAAYDVDEVLLLLNANDYARRDSIYEGADNGLYRMYRRPVLMTSWFVRKAIYRWNKAGESSVHWYRWFFEGNEEYGQRALHRLGEYARREGIALSVVLLPAGVAFRDGGYVLADVNARIAAFLEHEGIPHLDPAGRFAAAPAAYFDVTDHFSDAGSAEMARVLAGFLRGLPVDRTPRGRPGDAGPPGP